MHEPAEMSGSTTQRAAGPRGARRVVFAAAGLIVGLCPLVLVELALVGLGLGDPTSQADPYAGFAGVYRPVFVHSQETDEYLTSAAVLPWFEPQRFPIRKAQQEFRVFAVGGSTVQGRPYGVPTAFSTWLEIALRVADPSRSFRVVNVGGISYASYRLLPIVDEILAYEPDLIILYTGHNEFLEDRTYDRLKRPGIVGTFRSAASHFRTYNVLEDWLGPNAPVALASGAPALQPELTEILNDAVGLDAYHRDAAWQSAIVDHYRYNVSAMVRQSERAGVPVILVNPAANLDDCRPFKSQHRDGLAPADRARFERLMADARVLEQRSPERASELLAEAERIDPEFAELFYWQGRVRARLGDEERAVQAFRRAKDLDVCPLRILEPMRDVLRDVAERTGTPLVDAATVFERAAGTSLTGARLFVDHVHPSIEGHQRLGDALADEMARLGFVRPRDAAASVASRDAYDAHLDRLDDEYFFHGRLVLAQVLTWAHRYDEAEAQLTRVVESHPDAALVHLQLGQVLARRGRVDAATDAWDRALMLDRSHLSHLRSLSLSEADAGSFEAADAALRVYLEHDPPAMRAAEARFGLATLRLLAADERGAARLYGQVGMSEEQLNAAARRSGDLTWWGRYRDLIPRLARLDAGRGTPADEDSRRD